VPDPNGGFSILTDAPDPNNSGARIFVFELYDESMQQMAGPIQFFRGSGLLQRNGNA
jgi:hypothetical protein